MAADAVEQAEETGVALAIDGLQFDGNVAGLLQGMAAEEVGTVVIGAEQFPVLLLGDGRKLLQVANHEQLHTAEGERAVAVLSENGINLVEQVGTHHGYFIDDNQVQTANQLDFLFSQFEVHFLVVVLGDERRKRQLEKGMDGGSAGIDGGDARGGQNHHALGRVPLQFAQESSFSCSCFSGQEQVGISKFYDLSRAFAFGIDGFGMAHVCDK